MNRSSIAFVIASLAVCFAGCTTTQHSILISDDHGLSQRELSSVLAENPIRAGENIRVSLLRKSDHASVHVVQVRHGEIPHVHQTHDLTVFVVRGNGEMTAEHTTKLVHEGDVIHVPAGARHYFVNKGSSIAVAVVVFSPPFDGQDTKPVE